MIAITPQACLEKPKHTTDSFGSVFFLPVSGYSSSPQREQELMLQYAGTTAGEASHIQLHLQRVCVVAGKAGDRLAF